MAVVVFSRWQARRILPAIARVVLGITIVILAACSALPGRATAVPAQLPTRTLAPFHAVTDAPTASYTSAPTELPTEPSTMTPGANESAVSSTTPSPTHTMSIVGCADTNLDFSGTTPALRTSTGQIAFIDTDGNVGLTDDAGHITHITTDANLVDGTIELRAYRFPTFSSDNKSLAYIGVYSGSTTITQTLNVVPISPQAKAVRIYTSTVSGIPYIAWSPDNRSVAFLDYDGNQGVLRIVSRDGGKPRTVAAGAYVYWDWSAITPSIIYHLGASATAAPSISLFDSTTNNGQKLTAAPGAFKAPQYSPDGKYILLTQVTDGNEDLVVADATGRVLCGVTPLQSGAAFAWSPNGRFVAWIDMTSSISRPGALFVQELASGKQAQMNDQTVGFFWSPDGDHLAMYSIVFGASPTQIGASSSTPTPSSQQATSAVLRIEVADLLTGTTIQVADTLPSSEFIQLAGNFDQYSRSLTPWSPDGHRLVFTTVSDSSDTVDIVIATPSSTSANVELKRITSGTIAFWSPG